VTPTTRRKLLVLDVAALGWDLTREHGLRVPGLEFQPLRPAFPALTCPAQAAFRTASPASAHGMVANGLYYANLRRPMFWEQSANLVQGPRIWDGFRARGGRVGLAFWQQSLGERVDLVISPRPIHKHEGGMLQDCYSQPEDLYARLAARVGRSFNLMHYWGPLASAKASAWITDALCALLEQPEAPELLLGYLPHLDYDLQRVGPAHPKAAQAVRQLEGFLSRLLAAARGRGYEVVVFGDYAIRGVAGAAVLPNLALRQAGLLGVRPVAGMAYPDFWYGRAFAMVDHEIAHVFCADPESAARARPILAALDGVDRVLDRAGQAEFGLDHPHSGDLVLLAQPGRWFAYPWWTDEREAPDFATHVDIHNKPGFDPCELFFGRPRFGGFKALPPFVNLELLTVSRDTAKIGGSHGLIGGDGQAAWATTTDLGRPEDLIGLAGAVRDWLG
jgi:hypothetical protein